MSDRDPVKHDLLAELGDLHRQEQVELAALDDRALELSAIEPQRQRELDERLLSELGLGERALQPAPRARSGRRNRNMLAAGAATFAVAAAAFLAFWPREAEVVAFSLILPPSDAELRGPSDHVPGASAAVFRLGRTLRFTLRPATRYTGSLGLSCHALQGDRRVAFVPQVVADAAGGRTLTVTTGPSGELDIPAGSWELRCDLSPGDVAEPSARTVQSRACDDSKRCVAVQVTFLPPL